MYEESQATVGYMLKFDLKATIKPLLKITFAKAILLPD